ncbi:M14-type cytosolic carboxypeptidase [Uliginosibacterium sp. H3]|uniref:M14-type cytosolic carboxypeptidase n=1 Tax=Uliginosibacterium silvisoli TaxID=3114758 RepID=A0ABU6K6Z7_9RHOO|nr:M14-type cytosolic carboxypeptidase [Uliginosibacterium sp. H3]
MSIYINSKFDSGNIEVVNADKADDIRLRIRNDSNAEFLQWFHFRLTAPKGEAVRIIIENAGECSYAEGWHGYQCAASHDRQDWFRIATTYYDGKQLRIEFVMQQDSLWLAYFQPYSLERHFDLLNRCAQDAGVQLLQLGNSVEQRSVDALRTGQPGNARKNVWIIARQHPGEAMAEWCAEGLLEALLNEADPEFGAVAREIRERACLYIVPNVNPDGSTLGNLRSNAAGANLNREWRTPTLERSPEILCVRQGMLDSGVDFFLDLHGDETLPYVFIDGSHMVPGYGERNLALQKAFLDDLLEASPDFQTAQGYADNRFDDELLTLASKWVANQFNCVALTLEMPFKDNANAPDARAGWSAARSKRLGALLLHPLLAHLRRLDS